MSQIDKSLFRDEPGGEGGSPFAAWAYAGPKTVGADFKDPRPLTAWVNGFLWADTGVSALLAVLMLAHLAGARVIPPDEVEELTAFEWVFSLTAIAYLAIVVLSGILILRWFWRANKNARALSHGLETTPGWAWGFFFIPIMNLFRPFRTMEEIWQSSQSPHGWRTVETPVLMRWWWGLWLIGNFVDNASGRLMDDNTVQIGATLGLIGYLLTIACNITFQRLINPIAQNQWAHSQDSVFD